MGSWHLRRNDTGNDPSPSVRLLANTIANQQGEEDANNTGWHIQQSCLLGSPCRTFIRQNVADQSCGVGGDDAARNGQEDDRQNQEIDLRVQKSLADLLDTELAALDTSLVDTDMLQKSNLFRVGKPFSLHRGIRNEEKGANAENNSQASQSDEHSSPASQSSRRAHVLETKRDETTDNLAKT